MRISLPKLHEKVAAGEHLAALTVYDATFAHVLDKVGVDILLVGDSLGMVCQGYDTTLSVSLEDIMYHTRCVVKGSEKAFVLADMPFGSYQASNEQAIHSVSKVMAAGAQMVKLEGGIWLEETVYKLTQRGMPVMAHLGLTPQYIHQIGGYKVQGRNEEAAETLLAAAQSLEQAGAEALLLELIPASLAARVTQALSIPTIGIGAGPDCSGQVLVMHDMLGLYKQKPPRFVKDFLAEGRSVAGAVEAYVAAVKNGTFPDAAHSIIE